MMQVIAYLIEKIFCYFSREDANLKYQNKSSIMAVLLVQHFIFDVKLQKNPANVLNVFDCICVQCT